MKDAVIPRKCMDGKTRMGKIKGYDCIFYKYHKSPYLWSECIQGKRNTHKECTFMKNPYECEYFEPTNKIKKLLTERN